MHSALSKHGLDVIETGIFSWSLDDWHPVRESNPCRREREAIYRNSTEICGMIARGVVKLSVYNGNTGQPDGKKQA